MKNILRNVPCAPKDFLKRLSVHSAATIHEAMERCGAMDPVIKPLSGDMKICGNAITVSCHNGDNLMLIKAISMAKAGDVIVADMGTITKSGPFGEVLAVECASKGVNGLVLSCCARDSCEIIELGFPVFSSGLCVTGTAKATLGKINHTVCVGNQTIRPGDIIIGDADGVVVIPLEKAEAVCAVADKRVASEASVMQRLKSGESLFDIYEYQKVFDRLGCKEE